MRTLGEISISSYCEAPLTALRTHCKRDASYREALTGRVNAVHCHFGDALDLQLGADGALVWQSSRAGTNLDEHARHQLMRAIAENPTVLRSEGGHYLLVDPLSIAEGEPDAAALYFGDDKTVYAQRPQPGRRNFYAGRIWAPRVNHDTGITLTDGAWSLSCGDRKTALTVVTGPARADLLAAVERKPALWQREAVLLARDSRGRYYYVDRLRDGGRDFRVFRGKKGAMKLTRLVDIAEDAKGTIFATKNGRLRLVVNNAGEKSAWWLRGKKKTTLVTVPIRQSQKLIYDELGLYEGKRLGTPCDYY